MPGYVLRVVRNAGANGELKASVGCHDQAALLSALGRLLNGRGPGGVGLEPGDLVMLDVINSDDRLAPANLAEQISRMAEVSEREWDDETLDGGDEGK